MKSCCDFHNIDCQQGRFCPVRALHAANRDVFPLSTGEGLKCPSSQPVQAPIATEFVALETANSDGTSAHTTAGWELTPLGWAVLACLVVAVTGAFYFF